MYSIPQAQKLVDTFGQFSGYKIIYSKSEAIPLNHLTYQTNLGTSPFKVTPQGMKYLGIKIWSPISKIVNVNGPELL